MVAQYCVLVLLFSYFLLHTLQNAFTLYLVQLNIKINFPSPCHSSFYYRWPKNHHAEINSTQRWYTGRKMSESTPICRCRVLYLGSSVPHQTKDGLQGIQEPLQELYPEEVNVMLFSWFNFKTLIFRVPLVLKE